MGEWCPEFLYVDIDAWFERFSHVNDFYSYISKDLNEMHRMDYLTLDEAGDIIIIAYLIGRLNGDELDFANFSDDWKDEMAGVISANQHKYKKWLRNTKFDGASVDGTILNILERVLLNGELSAAYSNWSRTRHFQAWFDYTYKFVSYYQNRN